MPGLPVGSCGFRCGMRHRAVQPLTAFVKLMWALGQARDGKPIYADKRRRGACPPIRLALRVPRCLMWYDDQGE